MAKKQYNLVMVPGNPPMGAPLSFLVDQLRKHFEFTLRPGDPGGVNLSREGLPYVGEVYVMRTRRKRDIDTAQRVLRGIDWLQLLPPTTCSVEKRHVRSAYFERIGEF